MSETEDRKYRVTWRSRPSGISSNASTGEVLSDREFNAAYYQRDDGLIVFKKKDGTATFTVAQGLVETIVILEDAKVGA